jgi:hypothetical protein
MAKTIEVWSKTTGEKQPFPVPEHFPDLFPDLVKSPPRKKADEATPADNPNPATPETPKEK